jgi:hypothetical protein
MVLPLGLRTSARHWRDLSSMLAAFERCLEACARLDAYRQDPLRTTHGALIDLRLQLLSDRIDQELDRVTAERLRWDLDEKRRVRAA